MLDAKELLGKAKECADQLLQVAGKLEKKELGAGEANAMTNCLRSAGSLYLSILTTVEGSKIILHSYGTPVELSVADRDRLDTISKLLTEKPSKRAKKVRKND